MTRDLAAFTPPGSEYPPYANASQSEEGVRLTVRGEGVTASMTMPPEEARRFFSDAIVRLEDRP